MPCVLVTGGAGYIGSHTVHELTDAGYEILIYDNLEKGHPAAVPNYRLVVGDLHDGLKLDRVMQEFGVESVVHFAAYIEAGESVQDPGKYFQNNTAGTLSLLQAMVRNDVKQLVFSSTAAVYGEPERVPIEEGDRKAPTNAYGLSKWMVEEMLDWFQRAYGLRSVSLRYFNAAGAHPGGEIGEDHRPETHLIPLILQVPLGKREKVYIFGEDYDTPDGTCIRDYIHVMDLASAHVLALKALERGVEREAFNVGNGAGFSVRQVIEVARQVTGHPIPAEVKPRRAGDPARLIAGSEKLRRELGWQPKYPDLQQIVGSAWAWFRTHPDGYRS
ncbi:MAG TPA: UDP-glucose 4-epimerase GalE [Armatimonadota bacterium]|nr:UDP-glucose 4-epimerase GalE [Armatimonadota bacterium]